MDQVRQEMEQAGADALELNIFYLATIRPSRASRSKRCMSALSPCQGERADPVASSWAYFSAMANMASGSTSRCGCAGAVQPLLQPDFDSKSLRLSELAPEHVSRVAAPAALDRNTLRTDQGGHGAHGGVHSAQDVLKTMMPEPGWR